VNLQEFLAALRTVALDAGYSQSLKPNSHDTNAGRRLHKQFWVEVRLVGSESISQAADNEWEITYHVAWQPTLNRDDGDFGLYNLADAIAQLNNDWQSKMCPLWDEPLTVSSATPEWNADLKAWDVAINVETMERRSWAPTS